MDKKKNPSRPGSMKDANLKLTYATKIMKKLKQINPSTWNPTKLKLFKSVSKSLHLVVHTQ